MSQTYPPPPPQFPAAPGTQQTNGLAIAGMVLGIVSIALFFLNWIDILVAIVGLILSIIGLNKSRQLGGTGRGMAITGIITSAVGIVAAAIFLIAVVVAVTSSSPF
jgi:hypothetical protein